MRKLFALLLLVVLSACASTTPLPPVPTPTPGPTVCMTAADATRHVEAAYSDLLKWSGRPVGKPDPFGLDYYSSRLISCEMTVATMRDGRDDSIMRSDEYKRAHPSRPPPGEARTWTETQLRDFQGDLMIRCPAVRPTFINGTDPKTGIRAEGDPGWIPRGIIDGWVWSLWLPYYPAAEREAIYRCILNERYTHVALQVARATIGGGYHGIRPNTEADVAQWGANVNTVLRELHANNLIPICAGVAPDDPLATGVDVSLCPIAINDWDNSNEPFCRLKALHETFPKSLLFFETRNDKRDLSADACSPSGLNFESGGQVVLALRQRFPRFRGWLLEVNSPEGFEENVKQFSDYHALMRDEQEINFEADTYWKFWENRSREESIAHNDRIMAAVPWLKGCMTGCSPHAPPASPTGTITQAAIEFDLSQATILQSGFDSSWTVTTRIDELELGANGVRLKFSKQDGEGRWPNVRPPGWDGDLQYNLGMVMKGDDGRWYAAAAIQFWYGLTHNGGNVGDATIIDPVTKIRGQIAGQWFYFVPEMQRQPRVGEMVGFFVTAGDVRQNARNITVRERSNVVMVPFPSAAGTSFVFTYGTQRVH